MNLSDKKLLIFPGLALLFVIIIIGAFWLSKPPSIEKSEEKPIPTMSKKSLTEEIPTPTFSPPTFTGEKEEDFPEELEKQVASSFDLIQLVPVVESNFKIDYDYEQAKFIVELQRPLSESQASFNNWIEENGFSQIPRGDFIFQ